MKKWLSAGLLILGLGLFGHGAYMQGKAWLAQLLIEQAWQQALKTPEAQLNWPAHNEKLTVLAGASGRNLAFAPSHFLPAAELGSKQAGALIAGHNDTHFAFLQHVKVGEKFTLQLQNGTLQHYKVTGSEVIHESENTFLHTAQLYLLTPDSALGISTTNS